MWKTYNEKYTDDNQQHPVYVPGLLLVRHIPVSLLYNSTDFLRNKLKEIEPFQTVLNSQIMNFFLQIEDPTVAMKSVIGLITVS